MAMTPLERKKKSLARKAAEARRAGDPTDELAEKRFYEYLAEDQRHWGMAVANLEIAGLTVPEFADDSDDEWSAEIYDEPFRGSIGRAERMVGLLLDAAIDCASAIKAYKCQLIDAAIAKIEQSDLTDPDARKQALAEIVHLNKLRDQLDKNVRWELPQWRVNNP